MKNNILGKRIVTTRNSGSKERNGAWRINTGSIYTSLGGVLLSGKAKILE